MSDLADTPVRVDPAGVRLHGADRLTSHGNAGSDLAAIARESTISVAQLEGRKAVALWKVESLAVLLGCLPSALISPCQPMETRLPIATPSPAPKAPSKETAVSGSKITRRLQRCSCGYETDWPAAFGRHLQTCPTSDEPPCESRMPGECAESPCEPCQVDLAEASWTTDTHTRPSGPTTTYSAHVDCSVATESDLKRELIDCHLRLAGAIGMELPVSSREAHQAEIERIRELVREVES